jgi:hypothetical protein
MPPRLRWRREPSARPHRTRQRVPLGFAEGGCDEEFRTRLR